MRASLLPLFAFVPTVLLAQEPEPPRAVRAVEVTTPVTIDGRLDEPVWAAAFAATGFLQREPDEGEAATQRTEVRFALDGAALYVGARMYDTEGAAGVVTRLVRRDDYPSSDYIILTFDTQHDHLGRTMISVNPSGVKMDAYGPGGSFTDDSWDPVWEVGTEIDEEGWTAEFRIPFSQLRFQPGETTWGLQIERNVHRLNEQSVWAFWRRNEVGGPQLYGHLEGLDIRTSPQRAEILPYLVGRSAHLQTADAADPFAKPTQQDMRLGVDAKYLLSSTLTLDATINPDFGQVEVDPAVVNLSAFETFFPERRPFFIEGRGLFSFGNFSCFMCSNVSSMNLFYSRRIGRRPQGGGVAYDAGEYADVPENTSILAAAKITGRTSNGWSIGVLNAVTGRESAEVITAGEDRFGVEVEPASNYFVGRLKKDLMDGNLVVGVIGTSVARSFETDAMAGRLPSHAETLGMDWQWWMKDRTYRFMGNLALTNVEGSPEAILRRQESSARYFQRPDREGGINGLFSDRYNPMARALRGFGGYARLAKDGGDWRWETAVNVRSPGFEANDLAYLSRADYAWMNLNLNRQFTTPTSWYRRLDFTVGAQQQLNFDGDRTDLQYHAWAGTQTPFYWSASGFFIHRPAVVDDRMTRGGPAVMRPTSDFAFLSVRTDSRKSVVLGLSGGHGWIEGRSDGFNVGGDVTVKPASNVSVSFGPSFRHDWTPIQYVTAVEDAAAASFYGTRYVFADLDRHTVSLNTRLNVTFSPTMSLELFAQPYLVAGRYSEFKEYDAPRSLDRSVYGTDVGTLDVVHDDGDRSYVIDPDGAGPAATFTLRDPDFNFRSLRGNAVFRWEYTPGSTLYLVWTQDRSDRAAFGDFDVGRDGRALFRAPSDNIFLLKVNYWIGL